MLGWHTLPVFNRLHGTTPSTSPCTCSWCPMVSRRLNWLTSYFWLALVFPGSNVYTQDTQPETFFEQKIRPVLVEHCYACHSSGEQTESGLDLSHREGLRKGGDRGPGLVPGDAQQSLLWLALSHQDPDLQMPPDGDRLSNSVLLDFQHS